MTLSFFSKVVLHWLIVFTTSDQFIAVRLHGLLGAIVLVVHLHLSATKTVQYSPFGDKGWYFNEGWYSPFGNSKYTFDEPSWPLYSLPPDHPSFSVSSSSLFCPSLEDKRPKIRPSAITNTSSMSHHGMALIDRLTISTSLSMLIDHHPRHRSCCLPTSFGNDDGPIFIKISSSE